MTTGKAETRAVSFETLMAHNAMRAILKVLSIAFFVCLCAAGAQMKVFLPGNPVPMTMQTFAVLLAGAFLGPVDGVAAVAAYLGLGFLGVPWFAGAAGSGFAYLLGPTAGYLFGFLVAAVVVGSLIRKTDKMAAQAGILLLGQMLILGFGALHLVLFMGGDVKSAMLLGVVPFLYGGVVKTAAALTIYRGSKKLLS